MANNRRFSILTLPQFFDGNVLTLNIVVLPRNQNPLKPAIEQNNSIPPIPDAPAFADAKPSFEAKIISGLNNFPNSKAANDSKPLTIAHPVNARKLFEALGKNLSIKNFNQTNEDLDSNQDRAATAVPEELSVSKYLPISYRKAFNFTTPRTRNAKTDDSYHCAVRNAERVPGFKRTPDEISWGKVFAYALRQPLLAHQLGIIYTAQFTVDAAHFPQGGWLYVDLTANSDYKTQQQVDDNFIKKYAARIPALKPVEKRQVFAPILFPVLFKANAADPDPVPDGNYDKIFIEAAEYGDGFGKIVHAHQPRSRNLLLEDSDGDHPVKDVGIRLGWDDEQILIWYMRQMMIDNSVTNPDKRIDAPLGVFGYAVDIREPSTPPNPWESLNSVKNIKDLAILNPPDAAIKFADSQNVLELPYQVYPAQLDGNKNKNYWLPMYFANWNGHSMVLPDHEAAEIYQTTNLTVKTDPEKTIPLAEQDPADPEYPNKKTGTGATGPAQNQLNKTYQASSVTTKLRYGKQYEFRIRLRDLSGGGAPLHPDVKPINETPSSVGKCHFKRYVAPNQPRIEGLLFNTDAVSDINQLNIRRPLLGYPAVVYTGKYADAVSLLKTASQNMQGKEAFGIADPDVNRLEITVEVQTLKMDNLLSVSGKDNYVHLYTTDRFFPPVNNENDFETVLNIPIVYKDCKVLHTGDEVSLNSDLQLGGVNINDLAEIVLPTARTIRLTIRGVCEDKAQNNAYYGVLNDKVHEMDVRFGQVVQVMMYKASGNEEDLFVDATQAQKLQGIYLQPDPPNVFDGKLITLLIGKEVEKAPDMIQRLAKQLKIENIGLTLTAEKGERIQFGCSSRIRHTLSPDNSSLTFSSKGDLTHHWLCCVSLQIDRDWTWDALEDRSFVVTRTLRFTHDSNAEKETVEVGDIEVRHTASFEALQNPKRNYTRLLFIDAVEPKNHRMQPVPNDKDPRFPDTMEVSYKIETRFKPNHPQQEDKKDDDETLDITLPITTTPAQIPKIASAGIALSPYGRNDKYSATEPRQRFLWIEFEEPVKDPKDSYFARVLAYTPDQLISNNHPDLFIAPQEPSLAIDPEHIRVITQASSNDNAGLSAMQLMQKATDSDLHYLLPLPPGIHPDADEMFGFFTYEFRVGHYKYENENHTEWCTARGRFGRPLRATGIHHPAPTLTCSVNRDEEKLYVSAPYAVAVFNGKNVTADPPRTQLWCLLYAQVKQADNKDYRNILLDDKQLDWRVQVEEEKAVNWFTRYDVLQRRVLKNITIKNWKDELDYGNFKHVYKLAELDKINKDATKYGTVVWSNNEIRQLLQLYGLPDNSPLSVLVVEILPTITNIYEHISGLDRYEVMNKLRDNIRVKGLPEPGLIKEKTMLMHQQKELQQDTSPLSDELGQHRVLRTSPLTEVPFIC